MDVNILKSERKIRNLLLEDILNDQNKKNIVEKGVKKAGFRNIGNLLDNIIFEMKRKILRRHYIFFFIYAKFTHDEVYGKKCERK
jgi:F0F1-type ATP synthase delta subunit